MAEVQSVSGSTGTASTSMITTALTVTAGHYGIFAAGINGNNSAVYGSVSSSQSDTISSIGSVGDGSGSNLYAFAISNLKGGSTSITLNATASTYFAWAWAEFSGRANVAAEQIASLFGSSFVTSHTGAANPAAVQAGDDVVSINWDDVWPGSADTFTAGTGWTIGTQNGGSSPNAGGIMMQYQNNVSSAIYTSTYTTVKFVRSLSIIFGLTAGSNTLAVRKPHKVPYNRYVFR